MRDRDTMILMKILQYADEINGTITRFNLDIDKFRNDYVVKNAIAMCVLQIGELVNTLTDEFKAEHSKIPWRDIVSLRNRTAHAYISIDFEILWGIATGDVPILKTYCASIIENNSEDR